MTKKSRFIFGFTLIELLVVMTIAGILAGVSISGYMGSLRIHRRQDAVLSLQKAWLIIQTTKDTTTGPICATSSATYGNTNCLSSNDFYNITYSSSGYAIDPKIVNETLSDEKLILKAVPVDGNSQSKDTYCNPIYLSDQNKIYPKSCSN